MLHPAYIPSPATGVWHIGPLPIRGYALCIISGVIVAVWLGERRFVARGGVSGQLTDMAVWAVPAGLVGSRIYHLITSPEQYFGKNGDPVRAFEIWKGGLGIWGGVLAGVLTGVWYCRRHGIDAVLMMDAAAPGIALAQAMGRVGNWFNQELYGGPTSLPWGLKIDAAHRPPNTPTIGIYQPTFLYELLWDALLVALVVILVDRKVHLGRGRAFALYVLLYTVGREWIEALRVDPATHIFGIRLNDYVCAIVFLGAAAYLYRTRGTDGVVPVPAPDDVPDDAAGPSEGGADAPATAPAP